MPADTNAVKSGDHARSIEADKWTRSYLVHVPESFDGSKPYPVVLVYHGGGSNAEQMVRFCGLNETADKAGFIAVYPNGTGPTANLLSWNGGNCCGYAMQIKVDDVAFTKALGSRRTWLRRPWRKSASLWKVRHGSTLFTNALNASRGLP
jgi:polyhydroxybutyrate depolymerase